MRETPRYREEVERLLNDLARSIERVLADQLIGLYLYGSYVAGGFDPDRSDVDLLAVTVDVVNGEMLGRLCAMHEGVVRRHPDWDDRIEVAYLSRNGLWDFRKRRTAMGIISPGEPLHYRLAGADWLMNWYLVRAGARTLRGPVPAALIPPISHQAFIESVRQHARWRSSSMDDVRGLPGQSYTVLTMCRTLCAHHTGKLVSKADAAAWVANAYPEWSPLVQEALGWREHAMVYQDDDSPIRPDVLTFVNMVARVVTDEEPSRTL